jgi:hypothetical protein
VSVFAFVDCRFQRSGMAGYRIERVLSVLGPTMKEPVILRNTCEVEGMTFVKLAKTDQRIARLLLGRSSAGERPLAKTDILESLIALRNEHTNGLQAAARAPVEDLGLDEPQPASKKHKIDKSTFPLYIEIQGPAVEGVDAMAIKVLPEVGHAALWAELTPEVMDYLAKVAQHQIQTSSRPKVERQSKTSGVKGMSFAASRGQYRARREDGTERYFSCKMHTDPLAAAQEWVSGQARKEELSVIADAPAFDPEQPKVAHAKALSSDVA